MAGYSLDDFFALHHNCNNRELIKAVAHCARGPYRESLRKATASWWPTDPFLRQLRQLALMDEQPPLVGRVSLVNNITPTVTRVSRELQTWLGPLPPRLKPPPLVVRSLWDILNATDRYSQDEIKGAIWLVMYGDYGDSNNTSIMKPALLVQIRAHQHETKNTWERELVKHVIHSDENPPDWGASMHSRTASTYNIAKRIRAFLTRVENHNKPTGVSRHNTLI